MRNSICSFPHFGARESTADRATAIVCQPITFRFNRNTRSNTFPATRTNAEAGPETLRTNFSPRHVVNSRKRLKNGKPAPYVRSTVKPTRYSNPRISTGQ